MEEKDRKTGAQARSLKKKSGIIALIVVAALLVVGVLLYSSWKQNREKTSQAALSQSLDDTAPKQLSPELLRDEILSPALAYHPATAGSSLSSAAAAAAFLRFASDSRMHLEDQASVSRLMADAAALLTEEERDQLRETLPALIAFTEETLAVYPENRGVFDDAGCAETADAALKAPDVKADWTSVRTALEAAFLQS